jgi:hypothetical protein
VNLKLYNPARRFAFALAISLLLHCLIMWGYDVRVPHFKSALPPLTAKLEALPIAGPAKVRRKAATSSPKPVPAPFPHAEPPAQEIPLAASAVVAAIDAAAASAPSKTETLASEGNIESERPALPKRAQLTFNLYWGEGGSLVGETVHTLEIDDGLYRLHSITRTVGLTSLLKKFELTQYSSGTYGKRGLQPEQYFEERKESSGTLRNTVEFDHAAQVAHFSNERVMILPPDTQDFLSNMYQFPPLRGISIAPVSVSNGKKIERYDFEITPNQEIESPIGKLLTVRLHKIHGPNEEGLDIWLAMEYRLFPVKMQFFEKNGRVTGEAVITDIRVSEEEGVRKDVAN